MRTLKICIIAASLFLFAMPAIAAEYPQEIKDFIGEATKHFICKLPSSLSAKFYVHSQTILIIMEYAEKEILISRADLDSGIGEPQFISTKNGWKKPDNLTEKEENDTENLLQPIFNLEDLAAMQSCMESNLSNQHSRKLPQ